jgi:hypothetical protein
MNSRRFKLAPTLGNGIVLLQANTQIGGKVRPWTKIIEKPPDFRFGSKADISRRPKHVRFTPIADIICYGWNVR